MADYEDYYELSSAGPPEERPPDPIEINARESLRDFFENNRAQVFFSRQLEVQNEGVYFHWITNRAIRELEGEGLIRSEWRKLSTGTSIKLVWHKSYRYYRRHAAEVLSLVEEYSDPNIGASLGLHAELLVLEGFAKMHFLTRGRETREYSGNVWDASEHDLDFIFERDGIAYGVEVKNTLGYMDYKEFLIKIRLCQKLGLRPLFVVRMMPKSWIYNHLNAARGFALILKYQLYPWAHKQLAKRVSQELNLPVSSPRAIEDGTMFRFLRWHERQL
jgi:hypothetical protein